MQVESDPSNYRIDISPLFHHYCTKNAVELTAEFLGGFGKLTDLSCHIAMTVLKDNDDQQATVILNDAISKQPIDRRYLDMTKKVIMSYAHVLNTNFLNILTGDHRGHLINHVQVHDACHDYIGFHKERVSISGNLKVSVFWHN